MKKKEKVLKLDKDDMTYFGTPNIENLVKVSKEDFTHILNGFNIEIKDRFAYYLVRNILKIFQKDPSLIDYICKNYDLTAEELVEIINARQDIALFYEIYAVSLDRYKEKEREKGKTKEMQ